MKHCEKTLSRVSDGVGLEFFHNFPDIALREFPTPRTELKRSQLSVLFSFGIPATCMFAERWMLY